MTTRQTDEALISAFASGRRAALGTLAERYERPLLGLALAMLGDRELACDVVQETWLRVIRHAGGFDGRSRFKTWLYRIVINQCRSALAARQPGSAAALADQWSDQGRGPAEKTQRDEHFEHVRAAVARLDADKRAVVLLCYHNQFKHPEAAEVLGIPLGTLKSRLHAALVELREQLGTESKP